MPRQSSLFPDKEYASFLEDLKQRIRSAQVKAAIAVNQELILLYWQIGRDILTRQEEEGWGAKVIQRLAKDLKREFPDMKGFSPTNLLYMRAFAKAYLDKAIVQRSVGKIPWRHNQTLLNKLTAPDDGRFPTPSIPGICAYSSALSFMPSRTFLLREKITLSLSFSSSYSVKSR